ncbi:uncharacterized protein L201_004327 [Kwoniella dendrophila CBS 6074]|uniref:Uncharacterized protein n=1 Tax=Kwoniella dendrophila CBS 6074 TaxID=1295534 RepID=A0AAX4JWX2_9TREE
MDFSSSTAPVSRETWAPRSPSPPPRASYNGDQYSDRAPPSGPRGGDAPRAPPSNGGGSNNGGDYERERDSRDSRREGNG